MTEDQLGLMWKITPEPVLCFDGDDAGLKAAYRALDLALETLKSAPTAVFSLNVSFETACDPEWLSKLAQSVMNRQDIAEVDHAGLHGGG